MIRFRKFWRRYSHAEANRKLVSAEEDLAQAKEQSLHVQNTLVATAKKHMEENNYAQIIRESLRIGYGNNHQTVRQERY